MQQQKDIKEFSIVELKAMKSDLYEQISVAQSNLQVIHQELARRNATVMPESVGASTEEVKVENVEGIK